MKNPAYSQLLNSLLVVTTLSACGIQARYRNYNGVTFIVPNGSARPGNLVWSPNALNKVLITESEIGWGRSEVYILNLQSKEKQSLAKTDLGRLNGMTWSPDGKQVVISADPGTKGYENRGLWILNLDDNSSTLLSTTGYAAWSPNGNRLAVFSFVHTTGIGPRGVILRLIDLTTGHAETIYTNDQAQWFFGLSWAPDGQQLTFSMGDIGSSNLFSINIVSREVIQITSTGDYTFPAWSPAGNVIAFQKASRHLNDEFSSIHLISPDGKCEIEIPKLDKILSPTWSPDGKEIAFIGGDGIYALDVDEAVGRNIYSDLCQ